MEPHHCTLESVASYLCSGIYADVHHIDDTSHLCRYLRSQVGPNATIIGNYGASITGVDGVGAMMERGGSGGNNVEALQGYAKQGKTVEFHAQYAGEKGAVFNATLAAFLCGMGENAFYGAGVGWEFEGPGGCAAWLQDRPEYHRPLGEPTGPATSTHSGNVTVYTRTFKTGTHVMLKPRPPGQRDAQDESCIWWSDGSTTGNVC